MRHLCGSLKIFDQLLDTNKLILRGCDQQMPGVVISLKPRLNPTTNLTALLFKNIIKCFRKVISITLR